MKLKMILIAVAALTTAAVGSTFAAKSMENDALAVSASKTSLQQAVAAAEQHIGGKASKAEYERHKGQWVFDVEVIRDKTVMDVKVDPASGKVIAAVEDKADRDDDHDRAD